MCLCVLACGVCTEFSPLVICFKGVMPHPNMISIDSPDSVSYTHSKGSLVGHFVTMLMYIAIGVWVILATNETARVSAGSVLVVVSILGCVPLFMWLHRLKTATAHSGHRS